MQQVEKTSYTIWSLRKLFLRKIAQVHWKNTMVKPQIVFWYLTINSSETENSTFSKLLPSIWNKSTILGQLFRVQLNFYEYRSWTRKKIFSISFLQGKYNGKSLTVIAKKNKIYNCSQNHWVKRKVKKKHNILLCLYRLSRLCLSIGKRIM